MLPPVGGGAAAPKEDSRVIGEREAGVRREKGGFWIAFCAVFFYPTGWLFGRSRFEGLENIPARGGALVVAQHL
jgi:1-acyl-sn-glycerol-3-phosphate acyltransferase